MPLVETPLLVTPDQTAAVVTLLDWRRADQPCVSPCAGLIEHVTLTVTVPFLVGSVQSVEKGVLAPVTFEKVDGSGTRVRFTVGLQYAGMVLLQK